MVKKHFIWKVILLYFFTFAAWAFELVLPTNCPLRNNCYLFPSAQSVDISVLKKTDPDQSFMVVAAAPGKVKRVREGEVEYSETSSAIKECGNGVIIEHAEGWETQYCHLRKNSIVVHQGEQVSAGKVLGKIGASGKTTNEKLQFTVRHHGEKVDPFAQKLWRDASLAYQEIGLIDIGLDDSLSELSTIISGAKHKNIFKRQDQAMIAWVRMANIKQGDQQKFVFYSPDGNVYREAIEETIKSDHTEWIALAGYPIKDKNIPLAYNGEWRVVYSIKRGDKPWQELGEVRFTLIE